MQVDAGMTLNEIVLHRPEAVAILTRYGMDTCCGGALTLRDAAERHGVDLAALLEELEQEAPVAQ
jgi:iron-sulfur cluster repair protein YtfE (RIC family)